MNSPDELLRLALIERDYRLLRAEKARRSMADFVSHCFPGYFHSGFSLAVCAALDQFLEEVERGERPVLLLQAPPQHGKSQLVSRLFPAYLFGRRPQTRLAACSYAANLAREMNRDVQRIMAGPAYRALFPDRALLDRATENQGSGAGRRGRPLRNADRFDVPGGGFYVCAGVGGPLTGKSVDIGIIDDPIKNQEEARSATVKRGIRSWYETVFLTRLSRRSGHIIMATSWAADDLVATVAKGNPKARHLKFPAVSRDEHGRETALVPDLHPLDKLLETRAQLAPVQWSALYQQNPVRDGGNVFQEHWVRRWTRDSLPGSFEEVVLSWDMTFKGADNADFVVGQAWGRKGTGYYLLHQERGRLSFTASKEAVRAMHGRFPGCIGVLVEDKANGPAVMDALKDELPGIIPVRPDGSKISRAYAVTPLWSAGNVFIPDDREAVWAADFVEELITFPAGGHDDQVDAMTQALRHLKTHGVSVWEELAHG